jgi:hypothetical protein
MLGAVVSSAAEPPAGGDADYHAFDQRPGEGWRKLADAGKRIEAAELIDDYCRRNEPSLKEWQLVNLRFHAGQLYAFEGKKETALARFKVALYAEEPAESPVRWNAYGRATIAFLAGDRPTLVAMRDEIAQGPKLAGKIPNLDVVDRLLERFGQPYAEAYGGKKK